MIILAVAIAVVLIVALVLVWPTERPLKRLEALLRAWRKR